MKIFSRNYCWILVTIALTVLCYLPVFNAGFTNWDDDYFVTQNPLIQSFTFQNIKAWFTKPFMGLYQPLIHFSLALDYSIDGFNPLVFHSTNLLLHFINAVLVFFFVKKLFENNFVAIVSMILFAVHPIHVESVAWVTERKDLLYSLFYLLALILYVKYTSDRKTVKYLFVLIAFVFALFSKAMAVTLPFVLLLIDFYKGRNTIAKSVILEKLPFFIIALFFGLLAIYWHEKSGSLSNFTGYGITERVLLVFKALFFYISKIFIPTGLATFHPLPEKFNGLIWFEIVFLMLILIGFSAWVFINRNKFKILFFGYFFFILTIFLFLIPPGVPVIASERYAYIPSFGILLLMAFGVNYLVKRFSSYKNVILLLFSGYVIAISIGTYFQSNTWQNSVRLWNRVMEVHGEFYFPLQQRGIAHRVDNNYEAALLDFDKAIKLKPDHYRIYEQRGFVLSLMSDFENAEKDFLKAVDLNPESYTAMSNLGFIYRQKGEYELSIYYLNKSIQLNSSYVDAYIERAKTFSAINEFEKACKDLATAKTKFSTIVQTKLISSLYDEAKCNQQPATSN